MSKFKVGDNVKRVFHIDTFIERTGYEWGIVTGVDSDGFISFNHTPKSVWDYDYFELVEEWSIYNNTMPLSELTDEQVGAIFRHGIEKGIIEVRDDNGKWWDNLSLVGWHTALAYRAKQKSERELFIDAAFNTCPVFTDTKYDHEQLLNAMFDAGFKAPKVGE